MGQPNAQPGATAPLPMCGLHGAHIQAYSCAHGHTYAHMCSHMLTLTQTPLGGSSFPMAWEGKHSSGCLLGSQAPRSPGSQHCGPGSKCCCKSSWSHRAKVTRTERASGAGRHRSHPPTPQCCLHSTSPRVLFPHHSTPEPDTRLSLYRRQNLRKTLLLFRSILDCGVGQRKLLKVAWELDPGGHMDLGRWRHMKGHSK